GQGADRLARAEPVGGSGGGRGRRGASGRRRAPSGGRRAGPVGGGAVGEPAGGAAGSAVDLRGGGGGGRPCRTRAGRRGGPPAHIAHWWGAPVVVHRRHRYPQSRGDPVHAPSPRP